MKYLIFLITAMLGACAGTGATQQGFEPRTEIDKQLKVVSVAVLPEVKNLHRDAKKGLAQAVSTVMGFPNIESERVFRFETNPSFCDSTYDCYDTPEWHRVRSEISFLNERTHGTAHYSWEFFLPLEFKYNGVGNWHFTQVHGYGPEAREHVPFHLGLAEELQGNVGDRKWSYAREAGQRGYTFVTGDIKFGDLVFYARNVLDAGHDETGKKPKRIMFKLADGDEVRGRWHRVSIDVKYDQDPAKGYFKLTFNDATIHECTCQTAPSHKGRAIDYYFKAGLYRWTFNRYRKEYPNVKPPEDGVIYYRNIVVK